MDAGEFWDARYGDADCLFGTEPNRFVVELVGELPPGRALDLGAGEGRHAVWLAERGHVVTAVDASPVALRTAAAQAATRGVEIEIVVADLARWRPEPASYDLVLLAYLQLEAPLRAAVHRAAAAAVAPGGSLVLVAHHVDNLEHGVGGPPTTAVLYDEAMLRADFAALDVLRCERVVRATDGGDALDVVLTARTRPEA